MTLIIISGVPGTGKSALSNKIGLEFSIPVFSIDLVKAFFLKNGLAENGWEFVRGKGYQLLADLAENQLRLKQTVIVEGVFARKEFRTLVINVAKKVNANLTIIECICSDQELHKKRILNRKRNIDGLPEISWEFVQKIKAINIEWDTEHLIIDSINNLEDNFLLVKTHLGLPKN